MVSCQSYFLSEVRNILETVNPEKVRLLYWDDKVQKEEIYEPHDYDRLVSSTSPRGGGGTDVNCVTDYIAENKVDAQAAVIFTDGYFYNGWGNWHCRPVVRARQWENFTHWQDRPHQIFGVTPMVEYFTALVLHYYIQGAANNDNRMV